MNRRKIRKQVQGQKTVDGAGVHLVRVLDQNAAKDFDPFLMLDSFDSTNSSDYISGFPMHPHRGIETITYLISGSIEHLDSLGNKGTIHAGEAQWMVAGSGILHQEMPQEAERMLGLQLWLNMLGTDKMSAPSYQSITKEMIPWTQLGSARIGLISGSIGDIKGIVPKFISASIFDVIVPKDEEVILPTNKEDNVFIFLIEGDCLIEGQTIPAKTAVLFGEGDKIVVSATPAAPLRFIFCSGKPQLEPIAWGGPIVMNTQQELHDAFDELNRGTFIKHK